MAVVFHFKVKGSQNQEKTDMLACLTTNFVFLFFFFPLKLTAQILRTNANFLVSLLF